MNQAHDRGDPTCDACHPPRSRCPTCGALHADASVPSCSLACAAADGGALRTRSARIGRRTRRIFYVSPEEARREEAWPAAAGWYVNTLRPPASWIDNDPFGPYRTVKALLLDVEEAYLYEDG